MGKRRCTTKRIETDVSTCPLSRKLNQDIEAYLASVAVEGVGVVAASLLLLSL